MAMVESFAYRVPRFEITFPVEYWVGSDPVTGFTRNISDNGLLARFTQPLLEGTQGTLRFCIGTCVLEIEACVSHADCLNAGIAFLFSSDQQRQFVSTLVKVLGKRLRQAG